MVVVSDFYSSLISTLIFSLLHTFTFASKKSYIVYLGAHKHGLNTTDIDLDFVTNSHHEFLGSYLGSNEKAKENIFYSYTMHINGFAAMLEEEEAAEIAKNPDIVSVFLNKGRQLHTTPSWDFLGVEKNGVIGTDSIWSKARFGQDTIIGNLDTGVWPESKSFSDEGMGPIPSKWRGICQHGTHDRFRCNRKVIGARYFNKGYAAFVGNLNSNFHTVRDHAGHGSHTLSTAAGSFVPGASIFSNGNGTAKGGSPKAHVAAYKVCWPQINGNECFDADIMAAFDAAISDGVDVLSLSLGGKQSEFFEDGISIGSFHAVKKGIVVVASAGNSGPTPESVTNVSPWMFTVGASTMDREFRSYVTLGNKKQLKGASLSSRALSSQKFYPLISGETAKASNALAEEAILCKAETLDPKKVKGKLLVCVRGDNARADKGQQAALAGAVGMILVNDELSGNEIMADPHLLPASHINFEDGKTVLAYINSSKTPMAYITRVKTTLGTNPAPIMASFSSRGPNLIEPTILKPDITAPGVSVIAAFSEAVGPSEQTFDKRRVSFNSQSGTSMSCPHVAGVAGLLKTLHPDMSPAAIKSAIMTTATVQDNNMKPILDSTNHLANPFSYGAGHVSPNRAMDPGLVYDLTVNDYLNFLCARGYKGSFIKLFLEKPYICPKSFSLVDFNYPSITVPDLPIPGTVTITRRVKNVGSPGTYNAHVTAPEGIIVSVSPRSLKFKRTSEEKIFNVKFECKSNIKPELPNGFVFGHLMWSDGKHYVKSPLVVRANLTN